MYTHTHTPCTKTRAFNPLTTNGTFWYHQTLAAFYQLVQSALKIGFALVG